MQIFETENSRYTFDADQYKREPINVQFVESHRLKYDVWLPLDKFNVENGLLRIFAPDSVYGIFTSPITKFPEGDTTDA